MTATETLTGRLYLVVRHEERPEWADPVWVAEVRRRGDPAPVDELGYYETSGQAVAEGQARLRELSA